MGPIVIEKCWGDTMEGIPLRVQDRVTKAFVELGSATLSLYNPSNHQAVVDGAAATLITSTRAELVVPWESIPNPALFATKTYLGQWQALDTLGNKVTGIPAFELVVKHGEVAEFIYDDHLVIGPYELTIGPYELSDI